MNKDAGSECLDAADVAPDHSGRVPSSFMLILPIPPSVNGFQHDHRGRPLGNRSKKVIAWCHAADVAIWEMDPAPRMVEGDFEIEIAWDRYRWKRSDIDNRIKPLLDWLQSRELIENDRLCWKLTATWGAPKDHCAVIVREVFL